MVPAAEKKHGPACPAVVCPPPPSCPEKECPTCPSLVCPTPEPARPDPIQESPPAVCPIQLRNVVKPIPPVRIRQDLGDVLKAENMKIGAELGVQRGIFAAEILSRWTSAEEYHLVDLWAHQKNYKDQANHDDRTHNRFMEKAIASTKQFTSRTQIRLCRNYTTLCATQYQDAYFDYIYVDARHDFKGVEGDLKAWWPKLKVGGIMAGHDYMTQAEVGPSQGWTVNFDGTKDRTGTVVRGAVDKFFNEGTPETNPHYRQVAVTYREGLWNTWYVRK